MLLYLLVILHYNFIFNYFLIRINKKIFSILSIDNLHNNRSPKCDRILLFIKPSDIIL